jgi:hypothetical protein
VFGQGHVWPTTCARGHNSTDNVASKDSKGLNDRTLTSAKSSVTAKEHKEDAEIVYQCLQLVAFTLLAATVMRLKLFWTPQLCLMTSLLASRRLFDVTSSRWRHAAMLAVVMAAMSFQGIANVYYERSIRSEFSNESLEKLIKWISTNTEPDSVFAGAMPTMASVKLCTGRPIVNHPHYEHARLRERTKLVYSLYSRQPIDQIWSNLRKLHVSYAVLEHYWCFHRPSTAAGCSLPEIWDIEDVTNRDRKSTACSTLYDTGRATDVAWPMYFRRVYEHSGYQVLKVLQGSGQHQQPVVTSPPEMTICPDDVTQ